MHYKLFYSRPCNTGIVYMGAKIPHVNLIDFVDLDLLTPMVKESQQLVSNEPVEFEK